LLHSFLEENEDDFMDRFWRGLNCDIQDIVMHEEFYSIDRMFRLACKAEKDIKRRVTNKCKKKVNVLASPSTVVDTSRVVDESPPRVPPSFETIVQSCGEGTHFVPTLEIGQCHVNLTMSRVEFVDDLVTPPILEDCAINLMLCDQTTEIYDGLIARIVDSNSYFHMSELVEISDTENGPCDIIFESSLDHIKLVHNDEVSVKVSQDNSLCCIILDPTLSLSHARNKIVELKYLKSVYALILLLISLGGMT
jgi:hypothetical protein